MIGYKNEFILIPKEISDKSIGKVEVIEWSDEANKKQYGIDRIEKRIDVFVNDIIIHINLTKNTFNIDEVGSN